MSSLQVQSACRNELSIASPILDSAVDAFLSKFVAGHLSFVFLKPCSIPSSTAHTACPVDLYSQF